MKNIINIWKDFNPKYKKEIEHLEKNDRKTLEDAFYKKITFGTGGLRGLMGIGTNRINDYTIGFTTQGLSNYLNEFHGDKEVKVVIGYDSRNNSQAFAFTAANVLSANGIKVFIASELRPTPAVSFWIRHYNADAGIVCTASHNPKEYNGYKVYWNDGAQVVPPHDKNIIERVNSIDNPSEVKWEKNEDFITRLSDDADYAYIEAMKKLIINQVSINKQNNMPIVFTSIHGTGVTMAPALLKAYGFDNVHLVEEQSKADGNFPTVVYPNPEEQEAMSLGLKKAKQLDADLLIGTDPDADRIGIAVKNLNNELILLNGNQTATLFFNYVIENYEYTKRPELNPIVAKTIVTTNLIEKIAQSHNIKTYNVLTGFKWIAEIIRLNEAKEQFLVGGEESYGVLVGDSVRDKDAISASAIIAEIVAHEKTKGKLLFEKLIDLYIKYGHYEEKLYSLTKKGKEGLQEIKDLIENLRNNPPQTIAEKKVVTLKDYLTQNIYSVESGSVIDTIKLPKSDVLQFVLEDDTLISVRPSGTEPKIKFYFSANQPLSSADNYEQSKQQLQNRIGKYATHFGL